jgi:hypothetical protein
MTSSGVVARIEDRLIVSEFESGRAPQNFHHAGHVRVAFAYISQFPLLDAIAKFTAALKRFARAQDKPDLYHETITWAYLLLIHDRFARAGRTQTWEEFAEQNSDLLRWREGILDRCYSRTTLESQLARTTFLFPDAVFIAVDADDSSQGGR